MTRVLVEVEDFVDTARDVFNDVARPLALAANRLSSGLFAARGMAGDDPSGSEWAASYDPAAAAATTAFGAVIDSCLRLASLFGQSARNYAAADRSSTASDRSAITGLIEKLPRDTQFGVVVLPPTAVGSGDGLPHGWGLLHDLSGYAWPNGHQDRLHRAASAWSHAAAALDEAADLVVCDPILFAGHHLPEAGDVQTVCSSMARHLRDLAHVFRSLGHACTGLADAIDWVHGEVLSDLAELTAWIAATEAAAAATAWFTFGASEGVGAAAVWAEVTEKTASILAVLVDFSSRVDSLASTLPPAQQQADDIVAITQRLRAAEPISPVFNGVPSPQHNSSVPLFGGGEVGAAQRLSVAGGAPPAPPARVDLAAAERAGGHTIERHVGKTDDYLKARGIPRASTFISLEAAETATTLNISSNAAKIASWLAGSNPELPIIATMDATSGRVYLRASGRFVEPTHVITVLIRISGGYRVNTSYPDP